MSRGKCRNQFPMPLEQLLLFNRNFVQYSHIQWIFLRPRVHLDSIRWKRRSAIIVFNQTDSPQANSARNRDSLAALSRSYKLPYTSIFLSRPVTGYAGAIHERGAEVLQDLRSKWRTLSVPWRKIEKLLSGTRTNYVRFGFSGDRQSFSENYAWGDLE